MKVSLALMALNVSFLLVAPVSVAQNLLQGVYTIQQKSNGRYVDAYEVTNQDYGLVTRPAQNNDSQQWILTHLGNDTYTIQQKSNGRFMDAHEVTNQDYRLVTRPAQNNNSQQWILTHLGNDTYTIQQKSSGRYVDAYEVTDQDYGLVTRPAQNNNSQQWMIRLRAAVTLSQRGHTMVAGRYTKLPVSWYYKETITSSTGLEVKTVCNGNADTGLLLEYNRYTKFNDNSPNAGGNGKGSYLNSLIPGTFPIRTEVDYHIYVFSMSRSTAACGLYTSTDRGNNWQSHAVKEFGGTLVNVGPLRQHDFLEVQTVDNGSSPGFRTDTQMVLFDSNDYSKQLIHNDNRSEQDRDPSITITEGNWEATTNYVLIGKTSRSSRPIPWDDPHKAAWNNKGVEVRVDLIRGPLDTNQQSVAFPQGGGEGSSIMLYPGRYYAWVYAKTAHPVGKGNFNRAKDMYGFCLDDFRGYPNELAFTLSAERRADTDSDVWTVVSGPRSIATASLGSGSGEGWNLFLLALEVDKPARYRLVTDNRKQDVTFHDKWRVMRNPDASEITVATFNTLYDGSKHEEKTRNASNLLATRGVIRPRHLSIEEPVDQARWQLDSDIIGLQELRKAYRPRTNPMDPSPDLFYLADIFASEAEDQGSRRWKYVKGRDEDFTAGRSGLGPVFFAENIWPSSRETSIFFSSIARDHAGCTTHGVLDYAECQLEAFGGIFKATNFAIPGKAAARRFGTSPDRRIAVLNMHLEHRSEDGDDRRQEVESLISTIDRLLEKEPNAFNNGGRNPDRKHPKFYQNRIIILGDSNFMCHACGEHYWILRRLRDHFGYAIDVSMVFVRQGNHFGMHDRLDEGSIRFSSDSYQSAANWKNFPDFSPTSKYPWWAATFRGNDDEASGSHKANKGDRHDVIFLVGKGWAYDDPVSGYLVMSDRDDRSPMYPDGGGVEMWMGTNIVTDRGTRSYRPNYDLGYGTEPGKPALHSDHQPVSARLRVFVR